MSRGEEPQALLFLPSRSRTLGRLAHTAPTPADPTAPAEKAELGADLVTALADPVGHLDPLPTGFQPALGDHLDDVDDPERGAAQRTEDGNRGDGPENEFQVEVVAHVRAVVHLADGHGQHRVGDHPRHHHVRAHGAVVVFLLLALADAVLGDFQPVAEVSEGLVVPTVDIELLGGHFEFDCVTLPGHSGAEIDVDDVVTLRTPGDIVGVAEGVDLEGADVRGEQGEVLRGRGEHVPWIQVEEGHEEVKASGRGR